MKITIIGTLVLHYVYKEKNNTYGINEIYENITIKSMNKILSGNYEVHPIDPRYKINKEIGKGGITIQDLIQRIE